MAVVDDADGDADDVVGGSGATSDKADEGDDADWGRLDAYEGKLDGNAAGNNEAFAALDCAGVSNGVGDNVRKNELQLKHQRFQ